MCRKSKLVLWWAALALFWVWPADLPAAGNYQLTEQEWARLSEITNKLLTLNQQLSQDLTISQSNLAQSQTKLKEYQAELDKLTSQLTELKASSDEARTQLANVENLLRNSKESLKALNKEVNKLVWQRNIAAICAAVAIVAALM